MIPEGYKMQTTFFQDFNIANAFGSGAVKSTYNRAFSEWKDNVLYMKELTFVLNVMCWEHYHAGDRELSELYGELYHKCYDRCLDHFKGEELHEYWEFLD